jgi:hypothetical protein
MKKLISIFLIGFVFTVSQHLQAQITVEKGKTVSIEIPNVSNEPPPSSSKLDIVNAPAMTACNMQVKRGSEKTNVKIEPKSNKGIYEFEGRELGQETVSWEGKTKFRGFKTLRACNSKGQLTVETIESAEVREARLAAKKKVEEEEKAREEARVAQKKVEEEEKAREEARVAQKKMEEEERALKQAKLDAQREEKKAKELKAEMDKQAKRLKELEAKLKIAEAEAAKTPEQKKEEARIAVEAKALAEAKIAIQANEEQRKKALEEVRASRKMKVERRKKALEEARISKEKRKQNKERELREAKLAAQKKAKEEERAREEAKIKAQKKAKEEERAREWKAKEEEREREWKRREAQIKVEEEEKARERKGREAKTEPMRTKQPSSSAFAENIDYKWFSDGNCTNRRSNERCLSDSEYQKICSITKEVSRNAINVDAINAPNHIERTLLKNQMVESVSVKWGPSSRPGRSACFVSVSLSGMVDGNSSRKVVGGYACVIVKTPQGHMIVKQYCRR